MPLGRHRAGSESITLQHRFQLRSVARSQNATHDEWAKSSTLASTPMIALDLTHEAQNKGRAGAQSAISGCGAVWEGHATPALALGLIPLLS